MDGAWMVVCYNESTEELETIEANLKWEAAEELARQKNETAPAFMQYEVVQEPIRYC